MSETNDVVQRVQALLPAGVEAYLKRRYYSEFDYAWIDQVKLKRRGWKYRISYSAEQLSLGSGRFVEHKVKEMVAMLYKANGSRHE